AAAQETEKDQPADRRVRLEKTQALIRIVDIEDADLPRHMRAGGYQSRKSRHRHLGIGKGDGEEQKRAAVESDQPLLGVLAEEKRRGAHADQRVVLLVLMGIERVIADDPQDRAEIEQRRRE